MDLEAKLPTCSENLRMDALARYQILDTPPEPEFDDAVRMVAEVLHTPIVAINLIAEGRQWFKAEIGLGVREMPLDDSICKFAILQDGGMVIPDTTQDTRFNCNPLVTGAPGLRFYAGELLTTPDGIPLGTLCALDLQPRPEGLTETQAFFLRAIAKQVMAQFELRRIIMEQQATLAKQKKVEEALRLSEHRSKQAFFQAELQGSQLNALLEAAPAGIGYADTRGGLLMVNSENKRLWGDHPFSEHVDEYKEWKGWWADGSEKHGRRIEPHEWGLSRALQGEEVKGEIIEIEPFDMPGGRRTVLLRAAPVRDKSGKITGSVVVQMDISEQVKAQAALRESEAKFRTITDAMPQMVWATLPDGYHDYYNQRWYDYTGVPRGSTDGEGWNGMFHPDDQARAWEIWRRSLATGEPYEIQYRLRHHSGQYRWVLGRALPVRDDNGKIIRWMGTCTDIHHQKETENELAQVHAESERRRRLYETFLNNSPDLAYVFDINHRFTYANEMLLKTWGKTWDETIGKNWLELGYDPELAKIHCQELDLVIASKHPVKGELPVAGPSGKRVHEYILVPVLGPRGEVEAIAGTTRDVTDHKKTEEALRDANRRKDEFLAMLAHELRNPLAPISAAAEVMEMIQLDEKVLKSTCQIIGRQVKHMTGLVDDLLDVSRVTRGLVTINKAQQDLKSTVYSAIEQVRPSIESHRHHLTLDLAAEPAAVMGDQKRLVQIITNLLNNAAKYTPEGGRINLSMKVDATGICLTIEDNGIGISPELQPHIFELFTQADRTSDRSQGGLGVGLALVKSLTELHGGTVTCHSAGLGQGSQFTVTLPRLTLQSSNSGSQESVRPLEKAAKSLSILVVDDNVDAANMLSIYMQAMGHKVIVENGAKRALERANIEQPDVCVLDIGLPEMDGNELARQLRQNPATAQSFLIAVTGYGQDQDKKNALEAGFDRHLVKPVDISKLLALINEICK